jgi:hypothetical protein
MTLKDREYEEDFASNKSLRFKIRLLIRHPTIDPDRITNTLQLTPHLSAMVGTVRKTPVGTILPGLHRDSVWSHSFRVERNRFFFSDAVRLINKLEPHQAFLVQLDESGGSTTLILDLPGDSNIGDVFSWHEMARLSALRIALGIEVFPEFN